MSDGSDASAAWIALVPLAPSATFAPAHAVSAESANQQTEAVVLRALARPPHCCCAPDGTAAR
eukprot:3243619-Prymnesium_polylepis.1